MIFGLVNVDFVDVKVIMLNVGSVMLGIGVGFGKNCVEEVVWLVIMFFLFCFVLRFMGIVYNVIGGSDLIFYEVNIVVEIVYDMVDLNVNVIFGVVIDESFKGMICMIVIVIGFREFGEEKVVGSV